MIKLLDIPGLGKVTEKKLHQASIRTVEDLVTQFPKGYVDQRIQSINLARFNEVIVLKVEVLTKPSVFLYC